MKQTLLAGLAALALAACSANSDPELLLDDGWARATLPGQPMAAAYLRIANEGSSDDKLLAVTSERGDASLHRTSFEDGMASMQPVTEGIRIAAGEESLLEPQGDHVMLMGLEAPLVAGETFTLKLDFETSGEREVEIRVLEPGAR
ncbi:copper chaperone PCu(A)C [Sphingomicrobium arenosum]|uniref:copper chaperone PCu(A)C n=1 Tax=Sphingomicrobium arenosum TaxID=2233861 RepID=UPI00223E94D0|nr:copper chaperone PCu(A)C [Sphingomicrobium arenosum]